MNPIELALFTNRLEAICDEMGAVLRNAAFSPNIRDRLDFSCAVFDADGGLCAQAAHIPVHLGSMAYAMADLVADRDWTDGDMLIVNDPFLGGTHLPDVTLVAPVFANLGAAGSPDAFVVNRAHHADIGAGSPGSMPISRTLAEEGVVIPPRRLIRAGVLDEDALAGIVDQTRSPRDAKGDFFAQISANQVGRERLRALLRSLDRPFSTALDALNAYGERLARTALAEIPAGRYRFEDWMDDDGQGNQSLPIRLTLTVAGTGDAALDFTGTAAQSAGNVNCPLAVAAAAVFYCLRCLMPPRTPACAGTLRPIRLYAPEGSLVNARRPAAVAAGNVETSTRIVDVVLGALAQALPGRIPAASHGSMNNLAMGSTLAGAAWDYYETIGGGMGAGRDGGGLDAVQTHMTNTLNTPIEVIEPRYPVRVRRYGLRRGSGGVGRRRGGDGLVREMELLAAAEVTLIGERRLRRPWGLAGGADALPGRQMLNGRALPGKVAVRLQAGDRLTIETPGGGGWGAAD